jgi:hypothetical protein
MIDKSEQSINLEHFIKMIFSKFDIPTKQDFSFLHNRLDKIEQLLDQKQPVLKKERTKTIVRRKSASSIVLEVVANHPAGTDFRTIKAATGFDDKKLRNIIFRLDKIKKMKRVKRGIYKKV